jgi:hypothetical protein
MQLAAFRRLVQELARQVPAEYLDGVAAVDVSPRLVAHPDRPDVYTLGECVPVHDAGIDEVLSRVVLYYGSFKALARDEPEFDWEGEASETLLHELRHHLEWRAGSDALEAYDWAVDQNQRRAAGEPFDPLFYEVGERVEDGVFQVEDDIFIERIVKRLPDVVELSWHRGRYRVALPTPASLPLLVALDGLHRPPPGTAYLVVRQRPRLRDLIHGRRLPTEARARAERIG